MFTNEEREVVVKSEDRHERDGRENRENRQDDRHECRNGRTENQNEDDEGQWQRSVLGARQIAFGRLVEVVVHGG